MNILSKGLSFIPKPKRIDTIDAKRGLMKFKNQVANIYEAQNKPEQAQPTSQELAQEPTQTQTQTPSTSHTIMPEPIQLLGRPKTIYNPKETL